jgi:alkylation response protein AidB-like acyl-CoA dehydrogenase
MVNAGLFRMWAPAEFGGYEVDPMTAIRIFEEVARIDSAAAWNLQISNAVDPFLAWLPDEGSQEIFANGPDRVMAGALFPPGQATPVDGGYRLSGRWPFVSGCHHCSWYMTPSLIMEGDNPKLAENGQPVQMLTFFSSGDAEIIDTWHTMGMRGTGSHDVVAKDVFIPETRTAMMEPLQKPGSAYRGSLYRMTIWPPVAALAPPALGIARAAINELIDLAKKKTPHFTTTILRERAEAQSQVARAETLLGSGRAYLYEALREGWQTAEQGHMLSLEQKLKIQLATNASTRSAADAVLLVHTLAGSSAIRNDQNFQRHFRDVQTITQHAHVSSNRYQSVGNIMFGLEMDWPFFAL